MHRLRLCESIRPPPAANGSSRRLVIRSPLSPGDIGRPSRTGTSGASCACAPSPPSADASRGRGNTRSRSSTWGRDAAPAPQAPRRPCTWAASARTQVALCGDDEGVFGDPTSAARKGTGYNTPHIPAGRAGGPSQELPLSPQIAPLTTSDRGKASYRSNRTVRVKGTGSPSRPPGFPSTDIGDRRKCGPRHEADRSTRVSLHARGPRRPL